MNLNVKQVILSKLEYDEMEQELNALRETAKSKTVTAIIRNNWYDSTKYHPSVYHVPVGSRIEFVIGADENQVIQELSEELENVRKENKEYKERVFSLDREMWGLKDESNSWKNLSWYKRLFV